jgi:hypothetical protein
LRLRVDFLFYKADENDCFFHHTSPVLFLLKVNGYINKTINIIIAAPNSMFSSIVRDSVRRHILQKGLKMGDKEMEGLRAGCWGKAKVQSSES